MWNSPSSIALPGLKCGTALPGTATSSPVRGLRPIRSPTRASGEGTEAAQLNPCSSRQGRADLLEHRAHDPLDVAQVEMRVGGGQSLDQIESGHASSPRIPTFCSVLRSRSAALARTCCAAALHAVAHGSIRRKGAPAGCGRSRYRDQDTPSNAKGKSRLLRRYRKGDWISAPFAARRQDTPWRRSVRPNERREAQTGDPPPARPVRSRPWRQGGPTRGHAIERVLDSP